MSILSACRSSLIAAVSVAALFGANAASAQSRPDLDALIYGAAAKAAAPVPAEPNVIMQQPLQDLPAQNAPLIAERGVLPSSSGGMFAALESMLRRSSAATNEPMDAQAAMTQPDNSDITVQAEPSLVQASEIQIAQSQAPALRNREFDDRVSADPVYAAPPAADNRRGRHAGSQPSSSRGNDRPMPARYAAPDIAVPYDPSYRVDAGDRLRIVVFGQDGLTNTYQIGASGSITMPLIGSVPARGRTPAQLAGAITARLQDGFIRSPSVAVEIEAYRPFFILGEVAAPGQYPYVPNMSVESAIAIAGGFSPRAKRDSVTLTHAMPDGSMRAIVPVDTPLSPGDTIMVGERWF